MAKQNPEKAFQYEYSSAGHTTTPSNVTEILNRVQELLPSGKLNILEVGCGNGWTADYLTGLGHIVTAVDTSESGIAIARKNYPTVKRFEVASAYDDLAQIESKADIVIALEVIEHLMLPRKFLQTAFNALRPEGHLILSTPYHGYLKNLAICLLNKWDAHHSVEWDGGHVKFFSVQSLSSLLRDAGFIDPHFKGAGRVPWLWKSMICRATKT